MNAPTANTTRAALEVARVALGRMMGAPPAPGAPWAAPMTMAARASDAWKNTEILLRLKTSRPDLAGQALLTEARRVDALDMDGTHALVAMREWVERTLAPGSAAQMLTLPPTDAEREVAGNALAALDRAMGVSPVASVSESGAASTFANPIPVQPSSGPPSQWAPQATPDDTQNAPRYSAPENPWSPARGPQLPPNRPRTMPENTVEGTLDQMAADAARNTNASYSDSAPKIRSVSVSSGLIMFVLFLVVAIGGAGAWYMLRGRSQSSNTQAGVDAYTRGSKEAARIALVKAVDQNPQDVRALTFLGRVSRE
ncbi:MAG: hypothetical protein ABI852_21585, partial [Gemmatimonadaceae bacterium]